MTLERIRAGDVGALELLLREAWPTLVAHLTGVAGSREAAEDAAQEAFVRLWERRERWQAGSARSLLFRIGRNVALDEGRRARVRARTDPGDVSASSPPVTTPERALARSELRRRIEAALDALPPRRREVFELVRFAELSHEEVAEVTGLAPQTVANHMSLALRDLRTALGDLDTRAARGDAGGAPPEERRHDG